MKMTDTLSALMSDALVCGFSFEIRPMLRRLMVTAALACVVAIPPVAAQASASAGPIANAATGVPGLASYPPLHPVQRAMNKTNLSTLRVTVEVQWADDGRVTQARIVERTPSAAVEKAVLNWARGLRFEAGSPGKGLIPFDLRNQRIGGGNLPMSPPRMTRP